jgi:pentose-5-phosphate-3-epimerase
MDGVFVPNISFGFPIMKHLKKLATKPLDVHLMIIQPDRYLEEFAKAGADILTVHYETFEKFDMLLISPLTFIERSASCCTRILKVTV